MAKERKPDLSSPEEEALEQHVHDMMDVTVPDVPTEPVASSPSKKSITVLHADDEPSVGPAQADSELSSAISEVNEQLSEEVGTAPLVPAVSDKKPAKKVIVLHDETEAASALPTEQQDSIPENAAPLAAVEDGPTPDIGATEVVETHNDEAVTIGDLMDKVSPLESEIESPETDRAVSEIIAQEGDELLLAQDAASAEVPVEDRSKKDQPRLLGLILRSPSFRWTLFLLVIGALVFAGTYPKTRYYALNRAGIRSSASLVITDQSSLRPLKNVKVTLAGQTVMSGADGKVSLSNLRLGPTELLIEKRAYATQRRNVTVGWGSNPLPDTAMKPQGVQYTFQVNDVFSGKPLTDVEATTGEFAATANEKGEIKLALDAVEADEVLIKFKANGYRDVEYKLLLSRKDPASITMTPDRKIAFISKRSGVYDVYKIEADGKNESLVLKGSGKESNNLSLLQHPTSDIVLLLSTRSGEYGVDGTLKQTLTYINLKDNSSKSITSSSQLKPISWIGNRMVYVALDDSASPDSTSRYKLMSYDYVSGDNRQLAAANYFNSVLPMGGKVYYAPSSAYQNGINNGVFAVHADGSGKDALLDKEAWNMFRTAHGALTVAVQQEWYRITPDGKPEKLSGQPTDTTSRLYSDSPDGKHAIWVDSRDGKGTLVLQDLAKNSEGILLGESGVAGPIRWLNNETILYRKVSSKETADYVLSIGGGTSHKVADVTNAPGLETWSY